MEALFYLKLTKILQNSNPDLYRLLSKVEINQQNGCWEFPIIGTERYGRFRINGKLMGAHQISYSFFRGEIPEGIQVCHKCDNRKCMNPDHLFLGSQSDNMIDAYNKGRITIPEGGGFKKGRISHNKSINDDLALIIKMEINKGEISQIEIAKKYGVKFQLVRDIKRGKSYINI